MSGQGAEGQQGRRMVRWIAGSFGRREEGEQELAAAVTVESSASEELLGAEEQPVLAELLASIPLHSGQENWRSHCCWMMQVC